MKGIDVSKWQGNIDWKRARADGVEFAIVRIGYGSASGSCTLDPYFVRNMEGALKSGIEVGAYIYSKALTVEAARSEAVWSIKQTEKYAGKMAFPLAMDLEDESQMALGRKWLTEMVSAFCGEVKKAGWYPMLYSNRNWLENYVDPSAAGVDIWLAQWDVEKPIWSGEYGIWQHTDTGRVDGITGNVDINTAYVDYPDIIKTKGYNGFMKNEMDSVPEWGREAAEWAVGNGIIAGDENGKYDFNGPCTRLQMCVFLKRLYDLIKNQ